ncbi:hypothetical protein B0H66DRAFT_598818 [Apodospora peruviana]|uniref:Uncharacterized protein n=1 Tax=Apodospora peruviana TaxID=516989 RepID=A0AAE0IU51_9PEZI|nr:hypothetical protein B0H66DRAFT_598818 [Apodospora peruviana]
MANQQMNGVDILVRNWAELTFTPLTPVIHGGLLEDDPLSPIETYPFEHTYTIAQTAGSSRTSAFLSFKLDNQDQMLVIWVSMVPGVGIFPREQELNDELLEKLSDPESSAKAHGFDTLTLWDVKIPEGVKPIWILAAVQIDDQATDDSHPYALSMTGNVGVEVFIRDPELYARSLEVVEDVGEDAPWPYKIAAGPGQQVGQPAHENITLAALIQSGFIKPTTYNDVIGGFSLKIGDPDTWEFIRGVFWNDDPACALFNDDTNNNGNFAWGADWGSGFKFNFGVFRDNIIRRSHFGDLQFLHAMGSKVGESPSITRRNILLWLEVMYKLACGNQGISWNDRIDSKLGALFNDNTSPQGSSTFRALILGKTTRYTNVLLDRRAIGSCFHVIQDSYALGHCLRRVENRHQMVWADYKAPGAVAWVTGFFKKAPKIVSFPADSPGRFKEILNFHSYEGQSERHDMYDIVQKGTSLDASNVNSFNTLLGARDAIDKCSELVKFWQSRASWDDVVRPYFEEVFALSPQATPSNNKVDEDI